MIVTESQLLQAMQFFEAKHIAEFGPLDKVSLPPPVSKLADLLGAMWYANEKEAALPDAGKTAALLREALGLPRGDVSQPMPAELPTTAGDDSALPACPLRDNGDAGCEACQ